MQYPWYFAFGVDPAVLSWRSLGASLRGARAAPGSCPAQGLQARAPLGPRSDCRVHQAAHSPGDRSQPWSISPCLQSLELQQLLQVVLPAGSTFCVPTAGTRCWQSSSCQLWVGKVTKLKGKVLYKKTQPPCVLVSTPVTIFQLFFLWCLC